MLAICVWFIFVSKSTTASLLARALIGRCRSQLSCSLDSSISLPLTRKSARFGANRSDNGETQNDSPVADRRHRRGRRRHRGSCGRLGDARVNDAARCRGNPARAWGNEIVAAPIERQIAGRARDRARAGDHSRRSRTGRRNSLGRQDGRGQARTGRNAAHPAPPAYLAPPALFTVSVRRRCPPS